MKSNIGVIGLAVMGENLAQNIERNGYRVSVFNIDKERVTEFIKSIGANKNFYGAYSFEELCNSLERPRKIMLMIKAGAPVDETINNLLPYLEKGDIIIDGGNSDFNNTEMRMRELDAQGILYVGSGVSGGELGALNGPSLMPGGNKGAWESIRPIFEDISAKAGKENSEACTTWIGGGGAGHFVKMVHNGIEYGDMQIICEGYDIARKILKLNNERLAELFKEWNSGRLSSYLIEITAEILAYKEGDEYVVDKILDKAGQKGTGKLSAITALEQDIPLSLITQAVYSRYISAEKELREVLSGYYSSEANDNSDALQISCTAQEIEAAIYAAKLLSYAQGFNLIYATSLANDWGIDLAKVAKIWRGGCIIRSRFLDDIAAAFEEGGKENDGREDDSRKKDGEKGSNQYSSCNLLLSSFYKSELLSTIPALKKVVATAALSGIPAACLSDALNYYNAITQKRLPANLLQAQRDYFGAHTYERVDAERGKFFHTNWTGEGGDTVSTVY